MTDVPRNRKDLFLFHLWKCGQGVGVTLAGVEVVLPGHVENLSIFRIDAERKKMLRTARVLDVQISKQGHHSLSAREFDLAANQPWFRSAHRCR